MNRGKSYRVLAVMLLIAFISLISRSLIYLVISLTIAVIIIMLLSKDVKERQTAAQQTIHEKSSVHGKKRRLGMAIPIVFSLLGVIMASYGLTGIFELETIFTQLDMMVEESFILISSIVIGILLALYGLTLTIKKWLE